ncbi:urocortin [Pelobates cultripes]|uniref:Urocortin n=1 Tax=Pelobates cultripes TaxID=61616 RepID=A0AAD1R951_PELCU|nr:urocortin [Pelobates cultripes]
MKTAPLLLLTCYLIFTAKGGARPLDMGIFGGAQLSLNRDLTDESVQALLYFLREKFQQELDEDPRVQLRLSKSSLSSNQQISTQELGQIFSIIQTLFRESINQSPKNLLEVFSDRLKREDPPISIDLTYHILRQMIEIAKVQNQKQQAEQNRIIFDSVGK